MRVGKKEPLKRRVVEPFAGVARITFDADHGLRENARLVKSCSSRRFISSEAYRAAKNKLTSAMWIEWFGLVFKPKTKTFVKILYHRDGYGDDPSGYVKAILDSVEGAIGVNDRYFAHSVDFVLGDSSFFEVEVTQC